MNNKEYKMEYSTLGPAHETAVVQGQLKETPLRAANDQLGTEIARLQEELDSLFDILRPVLTPEVPRVELAMADEARPPCSELVNFTEEQGQRVASIRSRLEYLRSRIEV